MKKLTGLHFTVIIFVLITFSCAKETPAPPLNGGKTAITSGTIAGVGYSSSNISQTQALGIYSFNTTSTTTGTELGFGLSNISVGTHAINGNDPDMIVEDGANGYTYTNYARNKGSITITTNDGSFISGTFSATLYNLSNSKDSINIVGGQFSNYYY